MKISEMGNTSFNKLNKVTESRYGFAIDYSKMTPMKARKMLSTINETINSVRRSHGIHKAEQNPKYMQMIMVKEGLTGWLNANRVKVMESDVGQAEALLAAKDMVDSIQDMLEKVGKMQIEQLPALADSIRDQIGSDQSMQFKSNVGQVLSGLMDQLNQAREAVDNASRALSGEQVGGMEMPGMGGGQELDLSGAPGAAPAGASMPGEELGPDLAGGAGDEFGASDAAAGGEEAIGREKR